MGELVMSDIKEYPLNFSLRGDNTVYIGCEHRGCRQNYAICMNIHKAKDEGRRKPQDQCSKEIDAGQCQAAVMRQEEIAAGHAIHYKPRESATPVDPDLSIKKDPMMIDRNSPGFKRGWNNVGIVKNGGSKSSQIKRKPTPVKNKLVSEPVDVSDFSSAVSQAMKTEVVKSEIEVTPDQPVHKESALERARRLRAERQKGI